MDYFSYVENAQIFNIPGEFSPNPQLAKKKFCKDYPQTLYFRKCLDKTRNRNKSKPTLNASNKSIIYVGTTKYEKRSGEPFIFEPNIHLVEKRTAISNLPSGVMRLPRARDCKRSEHGKRLFEMFNIKCLSACCVDNVGNVDKFGFNEFNQSSIALLLEMRKGKKELTGSCYLRLIDQSNAEFIDEVCIGRDLTKNEIRYSSGSVFVLHENSEIVCVQGKGLNPRAYQKPSSCVVKQIFMFSLFPLKFLGSMELHSDTHFLADNVKTSSFISGTLILECVNNFTLVYDAVQIAKSFRNALKSELVNPGMPNATGLPITASSNEDLSCKIAPVWTCNSNGYLSFPDMTTCCPRPYVIKYSKRKSNGFEVVRLKDGHVLGQIQTIDSSHTMGHDIDLLFELSTLRSLVGVANGITPDLDVYSLSGDSISKLYTISSLHDVNRVKVNRPTTTRSGRKISSQIVQDVCEKAVLEFAFPIADVNVIAVAFSLCDPEELNEKTSWLQFHCGKDGRFMSWMELKEPVCVMHNFSERKEDVQISGEFGGIHWFLHESGYIMHHYSYLN